MKLPVVSAAAKVVGNICGRKSDLSHQSVELGLLELLIIICYFKNRRQFYLCKYLFCFCRTAFCVCSCKTKVVMKC